jgi:uncharacterized membrane protein YtjA (UPF0391 family)
MFIWPGVNALNAAFMEYTGITAVANGLAVVIYFIFGYKGCVLMIEYLAKRK